MSSDFAIDNAITRMEKRMDRTIEVTEKLLEQSAKQTEFIKDISWSLRQIVNLLEVVVNRRPPA